MAERNLILRELGNGTLITLGAFCAGMGLHGFLRSSNFIDGGVTGVSMLLEKAAGWPLSLLIPVVNLPFLVLAWKEVGSAFAIRSCLAIALLACVLAFVHFPDVTPDPLLTAVFGGLFIGAGIGLAVRGGAVLDGTEIAALLISKRSSLFKIGDVILIFNILLFVAAIAFLGVEPALYSILTYVAAARTLDFVIYGVDEYVAVTIVSQHGFEIRRQIVEQLGRGVTVFEARGGRSDDLRDVLFSVVTRLEVGRIKSIAQASDPDSFVVIAPVSDVHGGVLKRAAHAH